MKKKLLSIGALLLGLATFASCANQSYKVKFNENWLLETTTSATVNAKETLKYTVKFEKGLNADNEYRSVSYGEGTYTTELQAVLSEDGSQVLYRYTTTLEIPVYYKHFATGGELEETDVVTSEVLFYGKEKNLAPISSTKTVISHSPTTIDKPQTLEQCYGYYNYTVTTTYNENLDGESTMVNHNKEDSSATVDFEKANDDYTTVDNEYLLLALRGIEKLGSQKFNVYDNSRKTSLLAAISASSVTSNEFTINETKETISYTPLTIKYDTKNSGNEQTIWIAETTESTYNRYRNVILRMELPVYYSYGSFIYTLTTAQYM